MRRDVISTCPVCDHELSVTRLHCGECGTTLEGDFSVGRFGRLDRDQLRLLESFLRARGNLREMERELGLSYPTLRGRVDGLVRALGLAPSESVVEGLSEAEEAPPAPTPEERRRVLERLARREITAEDAARALRGVAPVDVARAGRRNEPPASPVVPSPTAAPAPVAPAPPPGPPTGTPSDAG